MEEKKSLQKKRISFAPMGMVEEKAKERMSLAPTGFVEEKAKEKLSLPPMGFMEETFKHFQKPYDDHLKDDEVRISQQLQLFQLQAYGLNSENNEEDKDLREINDMMDRTSCLIFRSLKRTPLKEKKNSLFFKWYEIIDQEGKRILLAGQTEPFDEWECGCLIEYIIYTRSGKMVLKIVGSEGFFNIKIGVIKDGDVIYRLKNTITDNYRILDIDGEGPIMWFKRAWWIRLIPGLNFSNCWVSHLCNFSVYLPDKVNKKLKKVGYIARQLWYVKGIGETNLLGMAFERESKDHLTATQKMMILTCSFAVLHRRYAYFNRGKHRFHGDVMVILPLSILFAIGILYLMYRGLADGLKTSNCTRNTTEETELCNRNAIKVVLGWFSLN